MAIGYYNVCSLAISCIVACFLDLVLSNGILLVFLLSVTRGG